MAGALLSAIERSFCFMSQDTLMLYKLMVLYMLNKVDFPLTNSQISEFILDKGYTMDNFLISDACEAVSDFIDMLTNWYIRNNHRHYQKHKKPKKHQKHKGASQHMNHPRIRRNNLWRNPKSRGKK